MRSEPFSPHDLCIIVERLKLYSTWRGVRGGMPVTIIRYASAKTNCIGFVIGKGFDTLYHRADTVALALEDCNRIIMSRRPHQDAPAATQECLL